MGIFQLNNQNKQQKFPFIFPPPPYVPTDIPYLIEATMRDEIEPEIIVIQGSVIKITDYLREINEGMNPKKFNFVDFLTDPIPKELLRDGAENHDLNKLSRKEAILLIHRVLFGYNGGGNYFAPASSNQTNCIIPNHHYKDSNAEDDYRIISINYKYIQIHTLFFTVYNDRNTVFRTLGDARKKIYDISHLCHNASCCNPDHLIVETRSTNDKRKKCKNELNCSGHGSDVPVCIFPLIERNASKRKRTEIKPQQPSEGDLMKITGFYYCENDAFPPSGDWEEKSFNHAESDYLKLLLKRNKDTRICLDQKLEEIKRQYLIETNNMNELKIARLNLLKKLEDKTGENFENDY
jgi:hypothetical protein